MVCAVEPTNDTNLLYISVFTRRRHGRFMILLNRVHRKNMDGPRSFKWKSTDNIFAIDDAMFMKNDFIFILPLKTHTTPPLKLAYATLNFDSQNEKTLKFSTLWRMKFILNSSGRLSSLH